MPEQECERVEHNHQYKEHAIAKEHAQVLHSTSNHDPYQVRGKAISAASLSLNELVKMILARNTGAKANALARRYLATRLPSSRVSGGSTMLRTSMPNNST